MSPLLRVLQVLCFLPLVALLVLTTILSVRFPDPLSMGEAEIFEAVWVLLVGCGAIALLQILLTVPVGLHVDKRRDLSSSARVGWILGSLFVGSLALPVFAVTVLSKAPPAGKSPWLE